MKTIEQMYNEAKALVEDRTYNIGEISEKTGLQKTANGWVKQKSNKGNSSPKQEENKRLSIGEATEKVFNNHIKEFKDIKKQYSKLPRKQLETLYSQKVSRVSSVDTLPKSEIAEALTQHEMKSKYSKEIQEVRATSRPQQETNKENGVEKKTNKKPSIQEYMKAKDLMKKHEAQYKKEMDDFEYMERLKANGVNTSIFNPMFGGKPQPLENRSSYKEAMETVKSYETTDNACRITADTKIKLKNVVENKVKENA